MAWTIFEDKSNLTVFANLFRILKRKLKLENVQVHVIDPEKALLAKKFCLSAEEDSHISAFTIADQSDLFIVPDLDLHPQLQSRPYARYIRFYAGVKLMAGDMIIGVLSVYDSCARRDLFSFKECDVCPNRQLLLEMASVIADILHFRSEEQHASLINGVYLHQSILGVLQRPSQALFNSKNQLDNSLEFFFPQFFVNDNPHNHLQSLDHRVQWFQSDVDYMCYIMELALRSLTHVSLDTHTRTYYTDANADFFLFPQPSSNNSSATPSFDSSLAVSTADHPKHTTSQSIHRQEAERHGIMAARRKSLTLLRNTTTKYSMIAMDNEISNIITNNLNTINDERTKNVSCQPHPLNLSSLSQQQRNFNHHQHLCLFRRRQWLQSLHRLLEHSQTNAMHRNIAFNRDFVGNIDSNLSLNITTATLSDRMCISVSCDVSSHSTLLLSAPAETLLLVVSLCITPLRLLQQSFNQRSQNNMNVAVSLVTNYCVATQTLIFECRSDAFHSCPLDRASLNTLETLVEKVFGGYVTMCDDIIEVKLPAVSLTSDPSLWASLRQHQTLPYGCSNSETITPNKDIMHLEHTAPVIPGTLKIVDGDTVETVEIDTDLLSMELNNNCNKNNNDTCGTKNSTNGSGKSTNKNNGEKTVSFGLSSTGFVFPSLRIRTVPYDPSFAQDKQNNNDPTHTNQTVPHSSNVTVFSVASSTNSSEGGDTTVVRNPSLVADGDTPSILRVSDDDITYQNDGGVGDVKSRSSTMCSSVPSTPIHTNSLTNVNNTNNHLANASGSSNVMGNVVHFIANAWTQMFSPRTSNDPKAITNTHNVPASISENDNNHGAIPQSASQSFYSGYVSMRSPLSVVSMAVTPVSHHKTIVNNSDNTKHNHFQKNFYPTSPRNTQMIHTDSSISESRGCPSSPGGSAESVYSEDSNSSNSDIKINKKNNAKKILKRSSVAPQVPSY